MCQREASLGNFCAIVIENGGYRIKAGYAGHRRPHCRQPCLAAWPRDPPSVQECRKYVGQDVMDNIQDVCTPRCPIGNGVIENFDDMESLWKHIYWDVMGLEEGWPCLMTESVLNPKEKRERVALYMFNDVGVSDLMFVVEEVCALYCSDELTGLVLNIGEQLTKSVPCYEGHAIPSAVDTTHVSGSACTAYLRKLMVKRRAYFDEWADLDWLALIKASHCELSLNYEEDVREWRDVFDERVPMPRGHSSTIGCEKYQVPELLFDPSLDAVKGWGIHLSIEAAMRKVEPSIRHELWGCVVATGGSSGFINLRERLQKELADLMPYYKGKIEVKPIIEESIWFGASKIAANQVRSWALTPRHMFDLHGETFLNITSF